MPSIVGPKPPPPPPILVPRRLGLALQPELERRTIPARVTLDTHAQPFAGELREEESGGLIAAIPPGAIVTLATLRRPWNFVGIAFDPGDTPDLADQAAVALRVLTRGVKGYTTPIAVSGSGPQAVIGIIVGVACELVFFNLTNLGTPVTIHNVRGSIWGMGEK